MNNYFFRITLLMAFFFLLGGRAVHAFSGAGLGTSGSPYVITTCAQLFEINNALNSNYILNTAIDCSGVSTTPIASSTDFTGTLDGRGYSIANLSIIGGSNVGLFAGIQNATVQNIFLSNFNMAGLVDVGALAGYSLGGTISKVGVISAVIGNGVNGASVGGLIGRNLGNMSVSDSYVNGTVTAPSSSAGGLFGKIDHAGGTTTTINRAYFYGTATGTAGGFIGSYDDRSDQGMVITNSFTVASSTVAGFMGQLVGNSTSGIQFSNSYYDAKASTTFRCAGGGNSFSGCAAVNTDGSEPNRFINTTSTNPVSAWNFLGTWATASGSYPALYFPGVPFVHPSTNTLMVTEGGATSTYTVSLQAPPTASVTIQLVATSSLSLSTSTLYFTTSNWNTPQSVTVTGNDDHIGSTSHSAFITYSVSSADLNYNFFQVATTTVFVTDNPVPYTIYFNPYQDSTGTVFGIFYTYVPRMVSTTASVQYSLDYNTWLPMTLISAIDQNTNTNTPFSNGLIYLSASGTPITGAIFKWNIAELAAFFQQYPEEVAKYHGIYAIDKDSQWTDESGNVRVPCIYVSGGQQQFDLDWLKGQVHRGDFILVSL